MQLKRSKRPVWEYVVVTAVVALAMGMALALTARRDRLFKERLLILELQTFRNLSVAHLLDHRQIPKERKDWTGADPFGSPYRYHPQNGWVSTSTPGYESW